MYQSNPWTFLGKPLFILADGINPEKDSLQGANRSHTTWRGFATQQDFFIRAKTADMNKPGLP
jgi:hypothetical protein